MAKRTVVRRNAKMDLMTGFAGTKPPDLDLGLKGKGYWEQWTTLSLPDTGKNSSVDDEQQPTGSGSPETVLPGPPLKVPMEADDVDRPKIREGREAASRKSSEILRKVALQVRRLNPGLARRLMAASDEIPYETLSTAALELAGDEKNEVDDYQDNLGHGTIEFWGTQAARPTSLTRESSRRQAGPIPPGAGQPYERMQGDTITREIAEKIRTGKIKPRVADVMRELQVPENKAVKILKAAQSILKINPSSALAGSRVSRSAEDNDDNDGDDGYTENDTTDDMEVCFKLPDHEWQRTICKNDRQKALLLRKLEEAGAEIKGFGEAESKIEFASRGASRRTAAGSGGNGIKDINWTNNLRLVEDAMAGKYDPSAVANILTSDFKRTMGLLQSGHRVSDDTPGQGSPQTQQSPTAQMMTAGRGRISRTEGDKPIVPEPTVGDQDGPGAEGTAGFIDRSKAPLQETMTSADVDRPKIRNNPEASRSMWASFKNELTKTANRGGHWNEGRYSLETKDYGNSVEVIASVTDRENLSIPIGSMMFTATHDSPDGRHASIELNDGIIENRSVDFSLTHPRHASRVAKQMVSEVVETAKDILEGVTT